MSYYHEVIPFGQINENLTYKSNQKIALGSIVEISLRGKKSAGVVLSTISPDQIKFDLKKNLTN